MNEVYKNHTLRLGQFESSQVGLSKVKPNNFKDFQPQSINQFLAVFPV